MSLGKTDPGRPRTRSTAANVLRNSAANVARLGVTSLIAILLPAYLTHRLPVEIYGAWVLILQLGAYVVYLDFGVQTAVSKYIAEYEAKGDLQGCSRATSAGLVIIGVASLAGVLLTFGLALAVPALFHKMPHALYRDVRISIILVGLSLSINLVASIFSAVFLGLQRYEVPMVTNVIGRVLYALAIGFSVYLHSSLAVMGAAVAVANVASAVLQVGAWKKLAPHVGISLRALDRGMLKQMLGYCLVLSIWSVCMLFVSGIDLAIVGHYDFSQTAFYSIATSPTTFVLMLIGAVLGPLLPASSALSADRTPEQMGDLLLRTTRYGAVILLASGLPVLVGGYWLLRLWVGANYALHSVQYLRVLVIANILRNLCAPYATVVCGIGQQRAAVATAISEAAVNLGSSIYLASHFGAIGVAVGTLLGSVVSVSLHFALTMHYTQPTLAISRSKLFVKGLLHPAVMAVPTVVLLWMGRSPSSSGLNIVWFCVWAVSTALLGWFVALDRRDRDYLVRIASGRLMLVPKAS